MGLKILITEQQNQDKNIQLTDFTIYRYQTRLDSLGEKNQYLSNEIVGIELYGKMNIDEGSKEFEEINKLSEWAKLTIHEQNIYRNVSVEFTDGEDTLCDAIQLNQGFVVKYKEGYDAKKENGEFYIFIRELDEKAFGLDWITEIKEPKQHISYNRETSVHINKEYANAGQYYETVLGELSEKELKDLYEKEKKRGNDKNRPPHLPIYLNLIESEMEKRLNPKMSFEGKRMLKNLEIPYNKTYKYIYAHDKGNPVGIYPYWVGEGGITLGYGHYISKEELIADKSEQALAKEFGIEKENYNYIHKKLPIIVIGSKYVSLNRAEDILNRDIAQNENDIYKYVNRINAEKGESTEPIYLKQHEIDALIIYKYLHYKLNKGTLELLIDGNRNKEDWYRAIVGSKNAKYGAGWDDRNISTVELFLYGKYYYHAEEVI